MNASELSTDQVELENRINTVINQEISKLQSEISFERKAREETEEALLNMLKDVIGNLKGEIEDERKAREDTEEHLLKLLEETCSKVNEI